MPRTNLLIDPHVTYIVIIIIIIIITYYYYYRHIIPFTLPILIAGHNVVPENSESEILESGKFS